MIATADSDRDVLGALGNRLGHAFANAALLRAALTHPSLAGRVAGAAPGDGFERLEFLGDRVLSLVIAELLFVRFPHDSEGSLSRRHADLVRRDSLARVALALGLDGALRLTPVDVQSGLARNPGVLADAFEAVLGALFRDGGLEPARQLIVREFAAFLDAGATAPRDAKTALQEWAQGRGLGLPSYRILSQEGPAHQPRFVVEVAVAGQPPARGEGASKRVAEQQAAELLLANVPDRPA